MQNIRICKIPIRAHIDIKIVLLYMWTGIKEIKMDLLYKYTEKYIARFILSSHCFFIYIHTYLLPAHASGQGNVIGFRIYIYMCVCTIKNCNGTN